MTDSFKICKKCGLIQEPIPHTAPWEESCTNCGGENYDFVTKAEKKYNLPSICPKCNHRSVGQFIDGHPDNVLGYQKEIAEGTMRVGERKWDNPDAKDYVEMDSESSVLGYGISLIILNSMMYVGIPASVIIIIRKQV